MITAEILEILPPHSIFAAGVFRDVVEGVNLTGDSNRLFKWVALRGGIPDWTLYVASIGTSLIEIAEYGDKILDRSAFLLLSCDKEAQSAYRR